MKLLNGFKCQFSKILMCTAIYIKYFLGPINYITVNPRAVYQEACEEFPHSLNNCIEIEKWFFPTTLGAGAPMAQFEGPLETGHLQVDETLCFVLRLTYCQSSQVTEMLIAVR